MLAVGITPDYRARNTADKTRHPTCHAKNGITEEEKKNKTCEDLGKKLEMSDYGRYFE